MATKNQGNSGSRILDIIQKEIRKVRKSKEYIDIDDDSKPSQFDIPFGEMTDEEKAIYTALARFVTKCNSLVDQAQKLKAEGKRDSPEHVAVVKQVLAFSHIIEITGETMWTTIWDRLFDKFCMKDGEVDIRFLLRPGFQIVKNPRMSSNDDSTSGRMTIIVDGKFLRTLYR